jgi:hypothetical protein
LGIGNGVYYRVAEIVRYSTYLLLRVYYLIFFKSTAELFGVSDSAPADY